MTNVSNNVIYTGVTATLQKRAREHKQGLVEGFTKRYNIKKLVYFEEFSDIYTAISREKKIKGGSRAKKINLIRCANPGWWDLPVD